ncbi:MAG: protein-glutamate O-methyltransferase CheR [Myxococcota bacterium]
MIAASDIERAEVVLTDADFAALQALVERHLGIRMPAAKRALVSQRLRGPVARSGLGTWRAWADANLGRPPDAALLSVLADALTTNHTCFWREPEHFVVFRDRVLPEQLQAHARDKDLRVWCAAAATGEEPYQLAMLLRDGVPSGWTAGLLATDISARALAFARVGRYDADRLASLPAAWRDRYVTVDPSGAGTIRAELRRDITFRRLNLLNPDWPFRLPFDVVFCRNVLIYFDPPVRDAVVDRLVERLRPGGVLFVGHAESLPTRRWPITSMGPGIWRRNP